MDLVSNISTFRPTIFTVQENFIDKNICFFRENGTVMTKTFYFLKKYICFTRYCDSVLKMKTLLHPERCQNSSLLTFLGARGSNYSLYSDNNYLCLSDVYFYCFTHEYTCEA